MDHSATPDPELSAEPRARTVLLMPGEGAELPMAKDADFMRLKASGEDTAGQFALAEYHAVPGAPGSTYHTHDHHEEGFYVLEGELEMRLDRQVVLATPGTWVFVPRGVGHSFRNAGETPCRFLATFSPPGFENFFLERAELLKHHAASSPEHQALRRQYGTVTVPLPADAAPPIRPAPNA